MTREHTENGGSQGMTPRSEVSVAAGAAPSPLLFQPRKLRDEHSLLIRRPSISYWKDAWLRIRKNHVAVASGIYIILLSLTAVVGPWVIEYSHDEQEVWNLHLPPSLGQEAIVIDSAVTYEEVAAEAEDVSAETGDQFAAPPTPASIELMGLALTASVAFKWAQVPGVEGYRIYRSIDEDTDGIPLGETTAAVLSFQDSDSLQAGQRYIYRVFAFNSFGDSETSARLDVVPRLSLPLSEGLKFDPEAKPGSLVQTKSHYFGTDYLGRDLLARILTGARISLFIGLFAPLLYIFIGIIYGSVSGYFGGLIDDLMMRFADIVTTIPDLLAVIMLQVFLGSGVSTLIIALVLVTWARSARQIRGEVLRLRESEFVHAAKVLGTSTPKIIMRHLLPNTTGTILVLFTLAIPQAIFTEAFLSFIGLGIKPPLASWGTVVREGAKFFKTYPHEVFIPAVVISLTMFAFNRLGDGLRDALDPRLRGAE